ncbi:MAG: T9SS type A sorting domain-containing protein [Bacteroidetes bacterium]|nr:T9SS type A sorting domain-containing protein [Bacteroidota bacterium]
MVNSEDHLTYMSFEFITNNSYLKLAILVLFCISSNILVFSQILSEGLEGYWSFSGNALDSSELKNHGAVQGATLTYDRFGNENSAYHFDGNDYIYLKYPSTNYRSTISINFWIRTSIEKKDMCVINCFNSIDGEWGVSCMSHKSLGWYMAGGSGENNRIQGHRTGQWLNDTCWHMITFTYNSENNAMLVYIDARLSGTTNISGSSGGFESNDSIRYFQNQPWVFGAHSQFISDLNNNGPKYYIGDLDEVSFYNKVLNDSEVMILYLPSDSCEKFIKVESALKIYPVPTHSVITIEFGSRITQLGKVFQIYNSIGQLIYEENINSSKTTLDLKSLCASGMYLFVFRQDEKTILATKKVILF